MTALETFAAAQPAWVWIAVAAGLLAGEVATGSGYLLWPAAAASVVGALLFLGVRLGLPEQAALFAALTVAATLAARPWLKRRREASQAPDRLNDATTRLVGLEGEVAAGAGGRVFVDGKEWAAEFEGAPPMAGGRVRVLALIGGARLKVRAV